MDRKKYLLDTSVIIDSPANITSLYQNGENDIFITNVVLKELDKHKEDPYGERGFNARLFARALSKNGHVPGVSPLKNDHVTVFLFNDPETKEEIPITIITRFKYQPYSIDNDMKIIEVAFDYGLNVVTSDNYMRFSSLALDVPAEMLLKDSVDSPDHLSPAQTITLPQKPSEQQLAKEVVAKLKDLNPPNWAQITVTFENTNEREYFIAIKKENGNYKLLHTDFEEIIKIYPVFPINEEQKFYASILSQPSVNMMAVTGSTGSGKTLMALQEGIRRVHDPKSPIDGIIYLRNTVTANDKEAELGFRKGDENQKLGYFAYPLFGAVNFIIENLAKKKGTSIEELREQRGAGMTKESLTEEFMEKHNISIIDIAHARGITINNKFVIFDEVQNASSSTVKLIGTRIGKGSFLVLMGDYKQVDHPYLSSKRNGLLTFMQKAIETGIPVVQLKKTIRSEIADWFEKNIS